MCDKILDMIYKSDKIFKKLTPQYENLNLDEPEPSFVMFNHEKVTKLIENIVLGEIKDISEYDAEKCCKLCVKLSSDIRDPIKELGYNRYKMVCLVQICEKQNQGVISIARLLCDEENDKYAVFQTENEWFSVSSSVFALYQE